MAAKEAQARIRINRLLEEAGWRFFDDANGPANIALEPHVKISHSQLDAFGENFDRVRGGYVDFLLLDERGYPLVVLEAKSEDKHPLVGKEQAREYAESQNCRFVILSNGNLHYFWDIEHGNPEVMTRFPAPESIRGYKDFRPEPDSLVKEQIDRDYIVRTQLPDFDQAAGWRNEAERPAFIEKNRLRFLRDYQLQAIHSIQQAVAEGKSRFLFEMATGTGKTLTAAAVIKLFMRTGNARRVLFLVDRLELEEQANKAFNHLLKNDFTSVIYKERRDEWRKAEVVVTTVQSLLFNNKFERLFSPTDFDLVISDEAHRSIGGNARAVFEYFVGYKLGLTATPKDYLKKFDTAKANDPRELERRMLLDTYRTFGCETGEPTFRYSLLDGVKDGYLINPVVVDARTDITTQLLSDEGYSVLVSAEDTEDEKQTFYQRDFEKKFFSKATNRVFCETFLAHALRDPISGEIGKSIVFAVSQHHAARLTQMLNEIADNMFPDCYRSDFAVQVTSMVKDAQQFTINFANNNLRGSANIVDSYRTSHTRVCVTVGMMTTGYDCPDILNLALMRPVFSPQDFVQIKGRGTRRHNFLEQLFDDELKEAVREPEKKHFKLFDFFANCEYFEEKYNYDEVLELPKPRSKGGEFDEPPPPPSPYDGTEPDAIKKYGETQIGIEGMKIDRMFFKRFEDQVQADAELRRQVEDENWEQASAELVRKYFHKPEEFFDEDKLSKAAGVDRRVTLREILEKVFGLIDAFKSKDDLLEEEFHKFVLDLKPEDAQHIYAIKYFFKAYATDGELREIIREGRLTSLNVHPSFTVTDYKAVPAEWRNRVPQYVNDYVPLDRFK